MAKITTDNKVVVITGTDGVYFEAEMYSWHHVNGEDLEEVFPATQITSINAVARFHAGTLESTTTYTDQYLCIPNSPLMFY